MSVMKALLAGLAPAVLLAGPAFGGASQDVLATSLADATRKEMSVAPWVDVSVRDVTVGDQVTWLAQTSGRQLYSCAAKPTADALVSRDQVACARVALSPAQRRASAYRYEATARANFARIPFPGQAITSGMDATGRPTPY